MLKSLCLTGVLLLSLVAPSSATPVIQGSYTGTGTFSSLSTTGGTFGVIDPAVTTRFVAAAISNGTETAASLKTFFGYPTSPGVFNEGSAITATYSNVGFGDVLQFTESNVDLGDKPDLKFLVSFYNLDTNQLTLNPLAIDPDTLQSIVFPSTGTFLVGFSLIQTGGSTAQMTITADAISTPEINAESAALPLAISLGGLLVLSDRRRRR